MRIGDIYAHEEETRPLHANLRNTQQRSRTRKSANLLTTSHVPRALGQCEDVCNASCAGHGA